VDAAMLPPSRFGKTAFRTKGAEMPRKSVFERVFDACANPVRLSDHPAAPLLLERRDTYRKFLKHCLPQLAKQGADIDVRLDFVGNMDINAAAAKDGDVYLIGINVGTFDRLSRLYAALLSWPEVLPEIGNPKNETAADFDIARCLNLGWQPKGPRSRQEAASLLMPRDPTRVTACIAMNLMALDYIFAHEFAHVYDAHVDYVGAQGAALHLTETATADDEKITASLLHAIELEADMDAASMLASGVLHRMLIYRDFAQVFDERTFLLLWVFSILLLFHVFDLTGSPAENYGKEAHPHPEIRLLFVISSLQSKAKLGFKRNEQGQMVPVSFDRSDLEQTILACRDAGIAALDTALSLAGLEKAVLPNERRDPAAFVKEGRRALEAVFKTLEPVRKFAQDRHLGVSFEVPFDWSRS
jgi:hypothetical protein